MSTRPLVQPTIPVSQEDITAGWLSHVLGTAIDGVALEWLGGLSSRVYRARLSGSGRDLPGSVVVKLPSAQATRPPPGFDRELALYRHFGDDAEVRVPQVLFERVDESTGGYVLVLEDFPGLDRPGAPRNLQHIERVVNALAAMHARWWNHPELDDVAFLRRLPDFIDRVEAQLPAALPRFLERFDGEVHESERAVFEALVPGFRTAVEPLQDAPRTLVHHDLSFRNVLIGDGPESPIVFIDWQLVQHNAGVRDLSYFLGSSLGDSMHDAEAGLMQRYWRALGDHGVADYRFGRFEDDYRRSIICDFGRMVMTAGQPNLAPGMHDAVAQQVRGRNGSARHFRLGDLF